MNNQKGFTLIETLLYTTITTMVISLAIFAAYQMIDAGGRVEQAKELAENQKFLEQKIYYALQNVSSVNSPATGATTAVLSVNKIGSAENPIVIDAEANTARIKRGTAPAVPITDNFYVSVQELSFHQFDFSGQPAIKISGTLFNAFTSTTVAIDTTISVK